MRVVMTSLAVLALMACNKPAEAPTVNEADANAAIAAANASVADANATAAAATGATEIKGTSWEFTDKDGQAVQETIDDSGNYSATSGATEIDRGTAVIKDGKACFTSAMDKSGETCWTTQPVAIGQSMETTSDKGEKLTVTRVA